MRLFILSIICGAMFLSGCASFRIPSTPVKGVSNEMFEGTWESYPDVKRLTAKIIFYLISIAGLFLVKARK